MPLHDGWHRDAGSVEERGRQIEEIGQLADLTAAIETWTGNGTGNSPLIVLRSAEKYTLPLGMANLVGASGQGEQLWGLVMAGAVLATLPLLIAYVFGQKQFIAGLTTGSVRG
jgi:hypothetical protein